MATSLMGSCTEDLDGGCPLGSLMYHTDFAPTDTGCFGRGGSYRMVQLSSVWIFLSHNAGDDPLDFMVSSDHMIISLHRCGRQISSDLLVRQVLGNLGSDGSGTVTEFVLEAPPFVGFVKRECDGGDPSVNHLIVVDGSGGLPGHSCDWERGGACTGASSDLDDDIVSGIAPGSPILYLLYSSAAGSCIKEDEHRAIFDAAVRCLRADEPFVAVRAGAQPLVEVDVDDRGEIVFSGTGAFTGWAKGGGPSVVVGPRGADNALLFEQGQWLQLGESGLDVSGNWTLVCRVHATTEALLLAAGEAVLLSAAEAVDSVSVDTSLLAVAESSWPVLVVQQSLHGDGRGLRKVFVDGAQMMQTDWAHKLCDGTPCPARFMSVGADAGTPLQLAVHRLRLYPGLVDPNATDPTGTLFPLPYHAENSRWVEISRGLDGVDITWDTIGWEGTHEHVKVTLDPAGGISITTQNVSALWDRAVASASGIAGDSFNAVNWSSTALNTTGTFGLHIDYVDSDPCFGEPFCTVSAETVSHAKTDNVGGVAVFLTSKLQLSADLWHGVDCSPSNWPVGHNICGERCGRHFRALGLVLSHVLSHVLSSASLCLSVNQVGLQHARLERRCGRAHRRLR